MIRPTETELRRAAAAAWGDRPEPTGRPRMRLVGWRRLRRGSLVGFADVELPAFGLRFCGCSVFEKNGRRWATLPGRPQVKDGQLIRDDAGKLVYEPSAIWLDTRLGEAFSGRVCELVAGADPSAFEQVLDLEPASEKPQRRLPGAPP
jgi:hypothetical protein